MILARHSSSASEWLSASVGLLGVLVAIGLAVFERFRRLAEVKELRRLEERRGLDESRRLVLMALTELYRLRWRFRVPGRVRGAPALGSELIATLLNALHHHHNVVTDAELDQFSSTLITAHMSAANCYRAIQALERASERLTRKIEELDESGRRKVANQSPAHRETALDDVNQR